MNAIEMIGWVMAAFGISMIARSVFIHRSWKKATATVQMLGPEKPGESEAISRIYSPVIRFTTADGIVVCEEAPLALNFGPKAVGDEISVIYDPLRPSQFRSAGFARRNIALIGFVTLGLFLIFVA